MFTDIGYRALSQRDEGLATELLEEQRRVVRRLVPEHGYREEERVGEGFRIEFASACWP